MLSGDSKKNRIFYFDNLKVLLIVLVVFGHIINSIFPLDSRGTVTNVLWNIIYIFHMPLFIIISGYFSKKYDKYSDNTQKILIGLFLPYIIFNFLFYLFHRNLTIPILPDSAMWYLWALIFWRLTLPLLVKIKFILPISFFVSVMSNFISIDIDDGSMKILKYLPFFLLGYYLKEEHIEKLRAFGLFKVTLITLSSIVAIISIGVFLGIDVSGDMLYVRSAQVSILSEVAIGRILCLGLSLIVCFYLIAVIPNKKFRFTYIGSCTMTIYLLHYLPIMQKVYRKFIPQANEFLALVLCFVFSIVITFVFSRKCFVNIFNKFFDSIAKIIVNQK